MNHSGNGRRQWRRDDEGSGTMAGAMLVILVGALLAAVAVAGHLLMSRAQARTVADVTAVSAAQGLMHGVGDVCGLATAVAADNDATVTSCAIDDEDVTVRVRVGTDIPFMPHLEHSSRAGPVACVAGPP